MQLALYKYNVYCILYHVQFTMQFIDISLSYSLYNIHGVLNWRITAQIRPFEVLQPPARLDSGHPTIC